MATRKIEQKIEDALLALAAEKPFHAIGLGEIAARAGTDLATLRKSYGGRFAILESFARRVDVATLEGDDPSLAAEGRRERLFDAIMRRFDLLSPHRDGIAGLEKAARRDPLLACRLGRLSCGSQAWLLEAAGISTRGLVGGLRAPALAVALARLLPMFLADREEGLPKTMAALDATLDRLQAIDARSRGLVARFCRRKPPTAPAPEANDAAAPEPGADGAAAV